MMFVYGTALLVAAVCLLGFARCAVTRFEGSSRVREFAATESMALIIVCLVAFGIACLAGGTLSTPGGASLAEFGASLGVVALAILGVRRVVRATPAARPAVTPKPGGRATT